MPITDSKTGVVPKDYSIEELKSIAKDIRALAITAITAAGSGHTGGVMSVADITSALYFKVANHDPKSPGWEGRDRIYFSAGHKAPVLYAALGLSGYFDPDGVVLLRKLYSGFEGHPNRFKLPGIEASSGSLGQGLGIAIGSALNAKLKSSSYKTYCIMGDGELNEGSVWEAAMSASHYKLDNLIAIVDRNGLQIDGTTSEIMEIEPLPAKWASFGWEVVEVDGHDMESLVEVLSSFPVKEGSPTVLIAKTIKGKGISFAEDVCSYHGMCPKDGIEGIESLETALKCIGSPTYTIDKAKELLGMSDKYQAGIDKKVDGDLPKYSKDYWWNAGSNMKVDMVPNRVGFGQALKELGEDPKVVALGADITDSIRMGEFHNTNPERKNRFFSMGIAEQNMTTVAAGLAKEGYIPFIGSYGVFITGRNWDQIRTTVCYNNYNVKIACAHAGISVGPDGATHQALEEISNLYYLPNMKLAVPADSVEAKKVTAVIAHIEGPATIRYAREATPVISNEDTPYKFGISNIIRYRGIKDNFIDSFDTYLSTDYIDENEDIAIIACGPIVSEAMRAAYILKEEEDIETRIINMHTVKPLDKATVIAAAEDISLIVTCEEHQVGGFGNIVAGVIAGSKDIDKPYKQKMIGVEDRFGESGQPWELMKVFGFTGESIVAKVIELVKK